MDLTSLAALGVTPEEQRASLIYLVRLLKTICMCKTDVFTLVDAFLSTPQESGRAAALHDGVGLTPPSDLDFNSRENERDLFIIPSHLKMKWKCNTSPHLLWIL